MLFVTKTGINKANFSARNYLSLLPQNPLAKSDEAGDVVSCLLCKENSSDTSSHMQCKQT